MVRFDISFYSQEELLKLQNSIEENSAAADVIIENDDFPGNWLKWEKVKDRFDISQFLLFKKMDPEYPKLAWVFVVNVVETAKVLEEHYTLFKNAYGHDFDPTNVVFEIESECSEFRDTVFSDSTLVGLVYGFGKGNSFAFHSYVRPKDFGTIRWFILLLKPLQVTNPLRTFLSLSLFRSMKRIR